MAAFNDVRLEWGGKEHVVPARKMLRTIAAIEEVVTLRELAAAVGGGDVRIAKLSAAYGVALRAGGATISDDDVYAGMFANGASPEAVLAAVTGLLALMIPKDVVKATAEKKDAPRPEAPAAAAN